MSPVCSQNLWTVKFNNVLLKIVPRLCSYCGGALRVWDLFWVNLTHGCWKLVVASIAALLWGGWQGQSLVPVPTHKVPGSTQIEGIGTTNFGGRSYHEYDEFWKEVYVSSSWDQWEDQTAPDHVTVASVSLSALLKAKLCSRNSRIIQGRNSYWYRPI